MTSAALCFEDVALNFGEREILKGVSLEVPEGAVVALAGRNGAGKTTLLRIASRVLRPSAGRVSIRGAPVDGFSRRDLAKELAVVPQDTPVSFPFRVIEVVLMGRSPHLGVLGFESRADVALARDVMARVGI
jgi:iron complex transport system ATP-binding protein